MDLQTNVLNTLKHFLDSLTRFFDLQTRFLGILTGLDLMEILIRGRSTTHDWTHLGTTARVLVQSSPNLAQKAHLWAY